MVDKSQELQSLIKSFYFFDPIHSFQMERAISFAEALRSHFGDEILEILKAGEDAWKEALGFYMKQTANIINLCKEKYGDEVIEILRNLDREQRLNAGHQFAISQGNNSLNNIIPFCGEDSIVEKSHDYILFRRCAARCRIGVLAKELGLSDLMYNFHCAGDPDFVEGFNPSLLCEVRKNAMYDDCCEHLIRYKKSQENNKI